ncbi:MAG: hypothetical protein EXS36_02180 [Pedosphaera sp.]|nr:hypothetical protein [Pedosphaera sp.]
MASAECDRRVPCREKKIVRRSHFAEERPYEREFAGLRQFAAISLKETRQLTLLHVGRNDAAGYFYCVMELADDARRRTEIDPEDYTPATLREWHREQGRIPAEEVIRIGCDLSRALASLYNHGLVHRDIKPSNIILVGGVPKLADVGLITSFRTDSTYVGTEGYLPPEGPGKPAAGIYGLGKVLYELSTGLDRISYPLLPPGVENYPDLRHWQELNVHQGRDQPRPALAGSRGSGQASSRLVADHK